MDKLCLWSFVHDRVRSHFSLSPQGLLTHVVVHQPEDPIGYFSEEIGKIKREMEESNVSPYP